MANEKRLIDANAFKIFLEEVRQDYLEEGTFSSDFAAKVIETVQDEYLANAPTVDAVEVVRCKDCKHRGYVDMGDDIGAVGGCELFGSAMHYDAFCYYGERKDNE